MLSGKPYHVKIFKDYLPQILLSPFLNTMSHLNLSLRVASWIVFRYEKILHWYQLKINVHYRVLKISPALLSLKLHFFP